MLPLSLAPFDGVAYRAISGVKPLWRQPNIHEGRFNRLLGHPNARPTQYLCLHPMGPMAEFLRHVPVAAADLALVARNVFALRPQLGGVLEVTFDNAMTLGIAPEALVDDDYTACQDWVDQMLAVDRRIEAIRVPSAALPGTENLVVFGAATPISCGAAPRRSHYMPCSVANSDGRPHDQLIHGVRWTGAVHTALAAWHAGTAFYFDQPDP
jgi:hypothetical protein